MARPLNLITTTHLLFCSCDHFPSLHMDRNFRQRFWFATLYHVSSMEFAMGFPLILQRCPLFTHSLLYQWYGLVLRVLVQESTRRDPTLSHRLDLKSAKVRLWSNLFSVVPRSARLCPRTRIQTQRQEPVQTSEQSTCKLSATFYLIDVIYMECFDE